MPETVDLITQIQGRMFRLGISQTSLVSKFIELGKCDEDSRCSFSTQVNFALTGKRTTKRYKELLEEISSVLDEIEMESNNGVINQ